MIHSFLYKNQFYNNISLIFYMKYEHFGKIKEHADAQDFEIKKKKKSGIHML